MGEGREGALVSALSRMSASGVGRPTLVAPPGGGGGGRGETVDGTRSIRPLQLAPPHINGPLTLHLIWDVSLEDLQ